jgi:hypothetical protein
MILMEDRGLSHPPFSMSVLDRGVLRKNSGQIPVVKVWHIYQSLSVVLVIVQHQRSLVSETSSKPSGDEESEIEVGDPSSDVEVFDGKFSDH